MKPRTLLVVVLAAAAGSGCGGGRSQPWAGGPDAQQLQGVWAIDSFETVRPEGGPEPDKLRSVRFRFDQDRLTISFDRYSEDYTCVLDPGKNPKHMTLIAAERPTYASTARFATAKASPRYP